MTRSDRRTVMVGMSGGIDSTVTAMLLKEKGYNVVGVTMKLWDGVSFPVVGERKACFGPHEVQRIAETEAVVRSIDLPFHVIDLSREYKEKVLAYFAETYGSGRTPNPCVRCNRDIKFSLLQEKAHKMGISFDYFATGHYARIEFDEGRGRYLLKRGLDATKDQTYFLSALSQEQLKKTLFPLGRLMKTQVREMARQWGLSVADKTESQDFLSCEDYPGLFEGLTGPGPIYGSDGTLLGEHRGLHHYTIGQRKGLRIATGKPMYVIRIDAAGNALIIGSKQETFSDGCTVEQLNWIAVDFLSEPVRVKARIRYKHRAADALMTPGPDGTVQVQFDHPQSAVTPGQIAVFYQKNIILGGGTIASPQNDL